LLPGKIDLAPIVISLLSITAAFTDAWRGRIYNWLTLPAIIMGILFWILQNGATGFQFSLVGVMVGFLILIWMYALKFLGAGDVKLLMALGAWGGAKFAVETAVLSVVLGGIFAFFILLFRGRLLEFISKAYNFILGIMMKEMKITPMKFDRTMKMPFGIPMAIAAVWITFANPFQSFGVLPW
jgi:prepilin peptidase CpaA